MAESKSQSWSNGKVLIAAGVSLLGAIALLVIFIIFLSLKKPSYSDLNKFIFATLIVNFALFVIYGVVAFMKDDSPIDYGIKTWGCCMVVCTAVVILTMISLNKSTERRLPTACLWTSIGVAAVIFLLNTLFCITDMLHKYDIVNQEPTYMMTASRDEKAEIERTEPDKVLVDKGHHEDSKLSDSKIEPRKIEPLAPERSLRKEIAPPRNSIAKEFKTDAAGGKATWQRTHFILGIEGGANMKRRWGSVIAGLQAWTKKLKDGDILISLFTFDSTFHIGPVCKSPSEFAELLAKGIEIRGATEVSLSAAIDTFADVIKNPEVAKNNALNYLQYGAILVGENTKYPDASLGKFLEFKKKEGVNFFFNITSHLDSAYEFTRLATALEGIHYSIRKGADLGLAFAEALERDPLKST
jgi:multisubunit Na+/H+ antiporter MnhB subunit